ncbi:hypothetical protein P4O66_014494, partial [Electrophorus voltai]
QKAGPGLRSNGLTCSLFPHVGRGVFSCVHFDKGDFLLEYRGDLISNHECERIQRIYKDALKVFMFEFYYNGKHFCPFYPVLQSSGPPQVHHRAVLKAICYALFKCFSVDASVEDDSLGRLVNDDHVSPNSKMKTIMVVGKLHLCLFATRSISPGEEVTYKYGDSEWPWRCKIFTDVHCE